MVIGAAQQLHLSQDARDMCVDRITLLQFVHELESVERFWLLRDLPQGVPEGVEDEEGYWVEYE